jgi:hypothetical protein
MTMRKITITLGLIAALFALSAGVAQARNGADDGTATELRHGADDPVGDDLKAHLTSVFRTIGADDRTQAALWAQRHGITSP